MPALNDRDLAFVSSFAELLANAIWSGVQADQERLHLRQQIEDLITDRDYQLLMQPIVSLQVNSVNGAKAPCRFRPFQYRSPNTWFADARTIFLQRELERAVLQKTLDLLKDLPRALKLPINVSLETLIHGDLPALIAGPSSDRVILKLTEHDYSVSIAAIQTQIKQLRRLGAKNRCRRSERVLFQPQHRFTDQAGFRKAGQRTGARHQSGFRQLGPNRWHR